MLSLLRLDCKQKNPSSPFRISIFLFLSYSFGIKVINTFIYSRSSLKNPTLFQTKMSKVFCILRPRHCKNPTWWGSTYLYSLCKGVPPPPGREGGGRSCRVGSAVLAGLTSCFNSEFTQQDCRKKRTAKRLCVTNMTEPLYLWALSWSSSNVNSFWSFTERSV